MPASIRIFVPPEFTKVQFPAEELARGRIFKQAVPPSGDR
jgi:hypothetical protein